MLLMTMKTDKILNESPKPTSHNAECISARWLRTKV